MCSIFSGESLDQTFLMFIHTAYQVTGNTCIDGSVTLAGENINVVVTHNATGFLLPQEWLKGGRVFSIPVTHCIPAFSRKDSE